MTRLAASAALGAIMLCTSGCGSLEVALGLRTRLDKIAVTSVSASLSPQSALSPGGSGRLIVVAKAADGSSYTTEGPGKGRVLYDSFSFDADIVLVNKKGQVSLPADPRISDGRMPRIAIQVLGHPDVFATLDVPIRYDTVFRADFSGTDGFDGASGTDGISGMDGAPGSSDPDHPSAGGDGTDGGSGGNGSDGEDGGPGSAVQVWVSLRSGAQPLLQIRAQGGAKDQYFLVDPGGGSLDLSANGGSGGRGGAAGHGGRGGSGGSGQPGGQSGQNGQDGWAGHDGAPGAAGSFVVWIDPDAAPYLDRLHFSNRGGDGRRGPAPDIRIAPVAPLW